MIISGGQTGVDRAALDIAIDLGIPHGGYCPKGRRAEDGIIPSKYNLTEHSSVQYIDRTLENVLSSDGTLILHIGKISNGTALTKEFCIQSEKPILIINLADDLNLPECSMGMSRDFEIAIEEGATHIRIGTALFGSRS